MEDRIVEAKEMVRKRGDDPYERDRLSSDIPQFILTGVDLRAVETGAKQWEVVTAAIKVGLQSDSLSETIEEVMEELE